MELVRHSLGAREWGGRAYTQVSEEPGVKQCYQEQRENNGYGQHHVKHETHSSTNESHYLTLLTNSSPHAIQS